MAPKNKKSKKVSGQSAAVAASSPEDVAPTNPAGAILQHKTKQLLSPNICPAIDPNILNMGSDDDEEDDDSANALDLDDEEDDDDEDDVCLHCQTSSMQIQVRCDECSAYICNHCHWCHEFQANHEIRVCDRCDAFYCRSCDEMDQCDDCGEVVCGTCSTLLSCKFCGGGLCEECATACGRCGIVLCSRDAKFAVDCDTCRLSYCLVCLASGNKDPCVRCGHRPSKRMEQLVHLRLKSIYKAFKSSTNATSPSSNPDATASNHHHHNFNSGGSNNHGQHSNNNGSKKNSPQSRINNSTTSPSTNFKLRENDDPTMAAAAAAAVEDLTPGALMLAAAASAAAPSSQLAAAAVAAAAAASGAPNSQLAAAAQAAAGLAVHNGGSPCSVSDGSPGEGHVGVVSAETYEAERIKAEAAAEALLAELDEEEQAVKSKKSKKKKKKQRQQAKKAEQDELKKNEDEVIVEEAESKKSTQKEAVVPPQLGVVQPASAAKSHLQSSTTKQKKVDAAMPADTTTDTTNTTVATSLNSYMEKPSQSSNTPNAESSSVVDPLEVKFETLVANEDSDGLEELLASVKGVPGKAVLRKNVKKALKRLRLAEAGAVEAETEVRTAVATTKDPSDSEHLPPTPAIPPSQLVSSGSGATPNLAAITPLQSPRVAELLTIVSQNHNKVSSNSRLPKGHPGTPKSECIMHMAPLIVGWVIGKNGKRIRDLMEESGARIWIDQDSMGPQEPRIVYVSGQRGNVDSAVRMITDLISKAPTETPNSKQTLTPGGVLDSHHTSSSGLSTANFAKLPGLPGINMNSGEAGVPFQLKPREKKKNGEASAKREMTCDPRFVPLLIGRRGWTIKNIQDSSGARVDIDQNVTPRKITISGSDAAVEIAARMVGDVLSYPHSLLHGATDEDDIVGAVMKKVFPHAVDIDKGLFLDPTLLGETKRSEEMDSSPERPASPSDAAKSRSHHSPPSSLIMAGDGKSTISATSSLSSTPEPTVSSANKGSLSQIPTVGALLPSGAYEQHRSHPQEAMMPSPFVAYPPASQSNQNLLHGGLPPHEPVGLGMRPSHVADNSGFLQNSQRHGMGRPMGGVPQPSLGHMAPRYDQPSHAPPYSPSTDPRHANQMMHQQNTFTSSLPPLSVQEPHQPLLNPTMTNMAPRQHHQPHQKASNVMPGSEMWSQGPTAGEDYGLAAAVDFLQHSHDGPVAIAHGTGRSLHQTQEPSVGGLIGLPGTAPAGNDGTLLPTGKEESNIVDSLFGLSDSTRNDTALLSGLQGLNLDPSPSDDPWGHSNARNGFDLPPIGGAPPAHPPQQPQNPTAPENVGGTVGSSSIFPPSTVAEDAIDRQHSRFTWGESA